MYVDFALNSSPEIGDAIRRGAVVLLPVGQIEEHGPHLPAGTDTYIVEQVAQRAARAVEGEVPVLVLPAVWSTFSVDAIARWPGLIKVRPRVVIDLVHDIVASLLRQGFTKVVLLNGHGNIPEMLQVALRELADEFEAAPVLVNVWSLGAECFRRVRRSAPGGAIHACEYETSLMLALDYPVDMSKAPAGDAFRFRSRFRAADGFAGGSLVTWSTWKLQESETGVYGDPSVATVETGRQVLQATVDNLAAFLREYHAWSPPSP